MIRLSIHYDNKIIDFQASGYRLLDGFSPQIAVATVDSVSERFDLGVRGANGATVLQMLFALEQAFDWARNHQSEGNAAWLYYAIDENTALARARIRDGKLFHDKKISMLWKGGMLRISVAIERDSAWRGALTAISLSNTSGSGTSGVTVLNHWDATSGHVNYVEIAANAISGNIPTPLNLLITNNYNNSTGISNVWVGHNVESDPGNLMPVLEAEDATGGTDAADATCSGGNKSTYTLATDGNIQLFTWALSGALLAQCAGKYFKLIARFAVATNITNVWFHPEIYYSSNVPLWQGALVRPSSLYADNFRDLGVIQLPPWLQDVPSPDALALRLYGKRAVASSLAVALDFVYLLPVESYRFYQVNGEIAYQSALVDDGTVGQLYSQNSSGAARKGDIVGYGEPIMVQPGKKQRLYFLHGANSSSDPGPIGRTLSIQAWYEPRRLVA